MEVTAVGRRFRVQPRKVRLLIEHIKGKHALWALSLLRYHPSKGAKMLRKVIQSAVANAVENAGLDPESLVISRIQVDDGPRLKRYEPKAMGRAGVILKRTSHISVVLEDKEPFQVKRSNAKPKPRPKLEWEKPKKELAKKVKDEETVEETAEGMEAAATTESEQEPETVQTSEEASEETKETTSEETKEES
ncbi:MAG TPA: 50S ribosomal protein L22 [Fimbriimonadales bacterium]|nr:50S ribosomal protein L22 [Fimbriimonadales bacterium]